MDIKNPEYILEIARQQSVTHAAEALFLTQSTLSQYLLKLEGELGTPLFIREKNRLTPTEAGQVYLQAARAIVDIQTSAEAGIAALKNEGFLCMGTSYWGLMQVTQLLAAFKERFPDITLRLFVDDYAHLKTMMQAGKIDLAVISVTEDDDLPAQGCTHLCREEMVLAIHRDHPCCAGLSTERVPLKQLPEILRETGFISPDEGSSIRRIEDKLFAQLLYRPNVICEVEREDSALRMVAGGIGASILSEEDVRGIEQVRTFRFDPPLFREEILVFRKGIEKTEVLTTLADLIAAQAAKHR